MKKTTVIVLSVATFIFGTLFGSLGTFNEECDCSKVENNLSVCRQALDIMPELTDSCINVMYAAFEQDADKLESEAQKINNLATKFQGLTEQVK